MFLCSVAKTDIETMENYWIERFLAGRGDGTEPDQDDTTSYSYDYYAASEAVTKLTETQRYKIDYNVLSVAALTLALIMMVEYIRHRLDHYAEHAATSVPSKPLFRAVLEGVYAELATLGVVEFLLHLVEEYYPYYNKLKKSVFTDVHFLFFYTAVLNAMMSIVTAIVATNISKKVWIYTEQYEINHHYEIQQAFQQVKAELDTLHKKNRNNNQRTKMDHPARSEQQHPSSDDPEAGETPTANSIHNSTGSSLIWDPWNAYQQMSIASLCTSIMDHIRYPHLRYRYDKLLVQVRFHDLRNHIITSYNLPPQIQISNYLMRNEQEVLMKMVHVSSMGWLFLTGAVCIIYYILGMMFYKLEDQTVIGTALSYIYFIWMASFVLICWCIANKMKSIFYTILHSAELWNITDTDDTEQVRLAQKQLSLFWYQDPSLIIKLIQMMQFGFAASLSTILVFSSNMKVGKVDMFWYILTLSMGYVIFVQAAGNAIPRYTVCTCLGQLVNEKQLRETVALYRLEKAKQKEVSERSVLFQENNTDDHDDDDASDVDNTLNSSVIVTKPKHHFSDLVEELDSDEVITHPTHAVIENVTHSNEGRILQQQPCNGAAEQKSSSTYDNQPTIKLTNEQQSTWLNGCSDTTTDIIQHETVMVPDGKGNARGSRLLSVDENEGSISLLADSNNIPTSNIIDNNSIRSNNISDDKMISRKVCSDKKSPTNPARNAAAQQWAHAKKLRDAKFREQMKIEHSSYIMKTCNFFHSFFTSERHAEVSTVFGAIVAFFLVGERVAGFVHSQGILSSTFLTFHFRLDITFWLLTTWLGIFISTSISILILLWSYGDFDTIKGCRIGTAAMIDAVICSVCLIALFMAEVERCCESDVALPDGDHRDTRSFFDVGTIPCSCPAFGRRLYGGLGTIEPYTSLVILRVLRHRLARNIISLLRNKYNWPKINDGDHDEHDGHRVAKSTHKIGGHHKHHAVSTSSVAEMWEAAIGDHPDIAAKYGEFSSEILRVMLGLSHIDPNHRSTKGTHATSPPSERHDKLFSLPTSYANLSPEAQEVILAGKLGRSIVRTQSDTLEFQLQQSSSSSSISRGSLSKQKSVMFEIKNHHSISNDDQNSNFLAPNARLLHPMRRCDRKFLPILDKWTTVDVLITRFEIVYLDVTTEESNVHVDSPNSNYTQEALRATEGGKGLRLCDVVSNRRVVGRVAITEIRSLHVERHLPYDDDDEGAAMSCENPTIEVESEEYWKVSTTTARPSLLNQDDRPTRSEDWCYVKEDHLKVETTTGTLVLRFFSDLEDAKNFPEHQSEEFEASGTIYANNAFQWVRSIGKLCGPQQIQKQQLPHLGDNTSNELIDYLVVVDRKVKGRSHRRVQSTGEENAYFSRASFRLSRPNLLQRAMSVSVSRTTTADDHNVPRQFLSGPLDVSPKSKGINPMKENSSSMDLVPAWKRSKNVIGNCTKPDSKEDRKVSFSAE